MEGTNQLFNQPRLTTKQLSSFALPTKTETFVTDSLKAILVVSYDQLPN